MPTLGNTSKELRHLQRKIAFLYLLIQQIVADPQTRTELLSYLEDVKPL